MKKLTLAVACSSLLLSPLAFSETDTEVPVGLSGTSYITGNVQLHDRNDFNGSDVTSTLEAGHTFTTGTTILVEFDGIQLGDTTNESKGQFASPTYTTLGVEQSFSINENLWIAAGYHHLLHNGETVQYRPLVKIGYNFDNGISISNRTRMQIQANDNINDAGDDLTNDQLRFDNNIAYQFQDMPVNVKYNNVYYVNDGVDNDNSMEHELRATWTRNGVQPYVEYRNQASSAKTDPGHNNNVLVVGASYAF
ncbi:oligogalacturonate-specific porin KdgM family protein [Psychromonas hadalis]|uniref:oligogalacturonate-specific porin KdgM family protein n=1 Tax=Psychromonas hadalis TaxID=211669 RepID=UPI0003B64751|nr:oligogalacturonate-specific porin KdgM family protein [Psychromonas hadalis]